MSFENLIVFTRKYALTHFSVTFKSIICLFIYITIWLFLKPLNEMNKNK